MSEISFLDAVPDDLKNVLTPLCNGLDTIKNNLANYQLNTPYNVVFNGRLYTFNKVNASSFFGTGQGIGVMPEILQVKFVYNSGAYYHICIPMLL